MNLVTDRMRQTPEAVYVDRKGIRLRVESDSGDAGQDTPAFGIRSLFARTFPRVTSLAGENPKSPASIFSRRLSGVTSGEVRDCLCSESYPELKNSSSTKNYPHMRERGSNGEDPQGRDGYKPRRRYLPASVVRTFAGGRDCNSVHSRKNIYVLHDDGRSVDAKPDMDLWRIAAECRARFNFPTVMAPHIRRRLGSRFRGC